MRRPVPPRVGFLRSTRAVAAVEFALVLPIMLLFMFGGYETVRAVNCARRLTTLANAIGQQITANTSGSLSNADLHFLINTTMVVFPQSLKDAATNSNYWWQDINVTMSSITFVSSPSGCTSACTYTPYVLWTSGAAQRPCLIPLASQSDQAAPDPNKLPADVFGSGSLIVVDIGYTFRPTIGSQYFPPIQLKRSVYVQPRYVSKIYYSSLTTGADEMAIACPLNAH